nr:hypothetical protein [Candidatus Sigynarchaeota archaeon]
SSCARSMLSASRRTSRAGRILTMFPSTLILGMVDRNTNPAGFRGGLPSGGVASSGMGEHGIVASAGFIRFGWLRSIYSLRDYEPI